MVGASARCSYVAGTERDVAFKATKPARNEPNLTDVSTSLNSFEPEFTQQFNEHRSARSLLSNLANVLGDGVTAIENVARGRFEEMHGN